MRRYLVFFLPFFFLLPGCGKRGAQRPSSETPKPEARVAIDPATTGTITGVVSFQGTPPERQAISMETDPACMMDAKSEPRSEMVVVNAGKLENVFVYVKSGLERYQMPQASAPVIIDQKGCRYEPHVAGVMTNEPVKILNSDRTEHNVHPVAQNNPQWNESQMPGAAPIERSFVNPELMMPIVCNQHPWMKMYLNVVANPFYAVSDAQGKFLIAGLPPGDYTIEALHERLGAREAKVHVDAKQSAQVSFAFTRQ
jgi:plastocyanin